nr:MAG TPA: hypothetical protein [Caudoviricetes sp.]
MGAYLAESLPNITGFLGAQNVATQNLSGAFYKSGNVSAGTFASGGSAIQLTYFDSSLSSSTYQANAPVQQAAAVVTYCIRY